MGERAWDLVLVGGGLANGLLALALVARGPARIAIVERGAIGGNHTWCFHEDDLPPAADFVEELVAVRWPGYEVRFPDRARAVAIPYAAIRSDRFAEVVRARVEAAGGVIVPGDAVRIAATEVELASGEVVRGRAVVDGRGPEPEPGAACGYQKFVGLELVTPRPHGLGRPILMDATLPQRDGYRFLYVLPLAPDRVLVEDTYFADGPGLDRAALRRELLELAAARGLGGEVVREEHGVLPMPWAGRPPRASRPLVAGYRGGWFHPATGFSFPLAIRLALAVAGDPAGATDGPAVAALARQVGRQARICHTLNRLAFRWFAGVDRWHIFARFYDLPDDTIRRFYALDMNLTDCARLLLGRPPRGLSLRARLGAA